MVEGGRVMDKDTRDARLRELCRKAANTSLLALDATDLPEMRTNADQRGASQPSQPGTSEGKPPRSREEIARLMAEARERGRLRQQELDRQGKGGITIIVPSRRVPR
jgi:hypothetical protein